MTIEQFRDALRKGGFWSEFGWDTQIDHGNGQVRRLCYLIVYGHPGERGRPLLTGCIVNQHPNLPSGESGGIEVLWSSQFEDAEGDLTYLKGLEAAYHANRR